MPTPAIRQYRKYLPGKRIPLIFIAQEGIDAFGGQSGLPGFPRVLGDPSADVNNLSVPMLVGLSKWIDQHCGPSAHPHRDALRLLAETRLAP